MNKLAGINTNTRVQLAAILRGSKGVISVRDAASSLNLPSRKAALILARFARQGWLSRLRRGLYIPVPLEALSSEPVIEDPWLIANELYAPCYIGGWSAAEYWNLTEQIFRSIVVITAKLVRDRSPVIRNVPFIIRTVPKESMFGLKPVWRNSTKVMVSDPARTMVDLLDAPKLGGGITSANEMLQTYLRSKDFDADVLIDYIENLGNRTVYKRLGFLLERMAFERKDVIEVCRKRMSKGTSRLDPSLAADRLVTAWNLWIPASWVSAGRANDRQA